jgi:hypothetical protein
LHGAVAPRDSSRNNACNTPSPPRRCHVGADGSDAWLMHCALFHKPPALKVEFLGIFAALWSLEVGLFRIFALHAAALLHLPLSLPRLRARCRGVWRGWNSQRSTNSNLEPATGADRNCPTRKGFQSHGMSESSAAPQHGLRRVRQQRAPRHRRRLDRVVLLQ